MPGRRKRTTAALTLLVALAAALLALRHHARRTGAASDGAELELSYEVLPERAADRAFQQSLDGFVAALRAAGLRIGRVLPASRSAHVTAPGLDDRTLERALSNLPLRADGPPDPAGEVHITLDDGEARQRAADALRETAIAVRERVLSAHPCRACVPAVLQHEAHLLVRLPPLDNAAEIRVRTAIEAPPALPVPIRFTGSRLVGTYLTN